MLARICTTFGAIAMARVLLAVAQTHTIQVPQGLFVYGCDLLLLYLLFVVFDRARQPEWAVDKHAQRG